MTSDGYRLIAFFRRDFSRRDRENERRKKERERKMQGCAKD